MLNLKLNGQPVELPEDFSMTLNMKSPIFSDIGTNSYPFKIMNTPRNRFILGHLNRIEGTRDPYTEFEAAFSMKGIDLFSGIGKFRVFNSKSFEGNILEGNGAWNYQMKNNYLQNYDFGSKSFETEQDAIDWINSCIDKVYPEEPCAFPQVMNTGYFEEIPSDTYLHNFNHYFTTDDLIHVLTRYDENRSLIVPMLYLRYILEKLFAGMGFQLDDKFFTMHPDWNRLVVYNSVTCNGNPDGDFFPYYLTEILFNYHLPFVKVSDFITGIETMFNVRFFVDNNKRIIKLISLKDVLKDPSCIDFSDGIISHSTELEEKQGGFTLSQEIDSDDTAYEELLADEEDALKYVKGAVKKVTELPVWPSADEMEIRYVIDNDLFYQMQNKTWIEYTFTHSGLKTKFIYKDGSQSIDTQLSTLISGGQDQQCNCMNKQINWRDITPRIFFTFYAYYGDHLILKGDNWGADGSLFFNNTGPVAGGEGLFLTQYSEWLLWKTTTKLIKVVRIMSEQEIRDFDFSKKITINGNRYLVKSIQATIRKNYIQPATLELYTVL